jgi:hypothetical protein
MPKHSSVTRRKATQERRKRISLVCMLVFYDENDGIEPRLLVGCATALAKSTTAWLDLSIPSEPRLLHSRESESSLVSDWLMAAVA